MINFIISILTSLFGLNIITQNQFHNNGIQIVNLKFSTANNQHLHYKKNETVISEENLLEYISGQKSGIKNVLEVGASSDPLVTNGNYYIDDCIINLRLTENIINLNHDNNNAFFIHQNLKNNTFDSDFFDNIVLKNFSWYSGIYNKKNNKKNEYIRDYIISHIKQLDRILKKNGSLIICHTLINKNRIKMQHNNCKKQILSLMKLQMIFDSHELHLNILTSRYFNYNYIPFISYEKNIGGFIFKKK